MSEEEQRIAIADAVGWTGIYYNQGVWMGTKPKEDRDSYHLPDYLHDLNAMHEAEKILMGNNPHFRATYRRLLIDASEDSSDNFQRYWMATAAQRAEAFLKTLGLWKP